MLKEIFIRQFADIKRREWPKALLLSAFFFLVIATFWVLKPLKRGVMINYFGEDPITFLGLTFGGAEAEQIGKVLNMVVAIFLVMVFTYLVRHFKRHHLVYAFAALFSVLFAVFALVIDQLNQAVVWSFYTLGDMFNTAMVVLFWAFANDITSSEQAKRTYGIIGLGGVLGGFVGATVVNASVESFGRAPLLLFCIVPMALIALIAYAIHRTGEDVEQAEPRQALPQERKGGGLVEAARLVFSSRYLLAIAGIICIYEVVSNIIDFQLAATVASSIPDDLEKDSFFAFVGQLTGIGSIVVQLLLTSVVMKRFGVGVALAFLPVSILLGTLGFLAVPILGFAAMMSASDNSLNYSINQSARETLYTPTSQDVTYKAKAFIDMFVQRAAKVLSVVLNLVFVAVFTQGVRWLSLVSLGLLAGWLLLVRFAGRRFEELSSEEQRTEEPAGEAELAHEPVPEESY